MIVHKFFKFYNARYIVRPRALKTKGEDMNHFSKSMYKLAQYKKFVATGQKLAAGIFGGLAVLFLWNAGRNDGCAEIAEKFGDDPPFDLNEAEDSDLE